MFLKVGMWLDILVYRNLIYVIGGLGGWVYEDKCKVFSFWGGEKFEGFKKDVFL